MTDQTAIVALVKAALEARGLDLRSACGAFEITRRVAWILRATGAGLLLKPSGNNCRGFAVDIVCFPDGLHFDILVNSETDNTPAWNVVKVPGSAEPLRVDPARWVAPTDPDPDDFASPLPPPSPLELSDDTAERLIAAGDRIVAAFEETTGAIETLAERLATLQKEGVRFRL